MTAKERKELSFILSAIMFIVICIPSIWMHQVNERFEAIEEKIETETETTAANEIIDTIETETTTTQINIVIKEPEEEVEEPQEEVYTDASYEYTGEVLNAYNGRVPTVDGRGTETYYNLDMDGVIGIMRDLGYDANTYPYWVRDDGCKMFGEYIMVAANLDVYPRGSLVTTTLGMGIVCDTGGFAEWNPYGFDIAVTW